MSVFYYLFSSWASQWEFCLGVGVMGGDTPEGPGMWEPPLRPTPCLLPSAPFA
jgi:hypothetical protein